MENLENFLIFRVVKLRLFCSVFYVVSCMEQAFLLLAALMSVDATMLFYFEIY